MIVAQNPPNALTIMLRTINNPADYLQALHGRATFEICAFTPTGERSNPYAIHMGLYNDPAQAERAACELDDRAQGHPPAR